MTVNLDQTEKYLKLGLKIAHYRKARNLTQIQLAGLLCISPESIRDIEAAASAVSLDLIFRLSDVLDVTADKFFE